MKPLPIILLLFSALAFIAGAANAYDGRTEMALLFNICGWCILIYTDLKNKDN